MIFWSCLFILLFLPIWTQREVRKVYKTCMNHKVSVKQTGAQFARKQTELSNLTNVKVEEIQGELEDYYDPKTQTIFLSQNTFHGTNLAALGVSSHEVGHAIQHNNKDLLWRMQFTCLPLIRIGSIFSWFLIFLGLASQYRVVIVLSVLSLFLMTLLQLITVPVEWNANRHAKRMLGSLEELTSEELQQINKLLYKATLTYATSPFLLFFEFPQFLFALIRKK